MRFLILPVYMGIALFVCSVTPAVYGQDLEALKASFAAEITALDKKNLDAAMAEAHDEIVLFGVFSPFPIVGKIAFRKAVQEYFSQHSQATFTPVDPAFSIIEKTGVAWGGYTLALALKGGSVHHSQGRYIFSYTYSEGKWSLVCMHVSPLSG